MVSRTMLVIDAQGEKYNILWDENEYLAKELISREYYCNMQLVTSFLIR